MRHILARGGFRVLLGVVASIALPGCQVEKPPRVAGASCGCSASELIELLGLEPLPAEGGFFVETYRAEVVTTVASEDSATGDVRNAMTAIYFLLTADDKSRLHRLRSDELWHFYCGDPVQLLTLSPGGLGTILQLGADLEKGHRPQALVPKGTWQGARVAPGGQYALVGTTVSPGFEFEDFELGQRDRLMAEWPAFRELITELTEEVTP